MDAEARRKRANMWRSQAMMGNRNARRKDFQESGTGLVHMILIRRRIKCLRAGKHTIGYCRNCGVHQ